MSSQFTESCGGGTLEMWTAGLWGGIAAALTQIREVRNLLTGPSGTYRMPRGGLSFWLAFGLSTVLRFLVGAVFACLGHQIGAVESPLEAFMVGCAVDAPTAPRMRSAWLRRSCDGRDGSPLGDDRL